MSLSFLFALVMATSCIYAFPIARQPAVEVKIVLGNDDGWAEANIRQFYYDLSASGKDVIVSAPLFNMSGTGSLDLPCILPNLLPGEYNSVPAGSPCEGANATDPRLNYYDSFPVTAVRYGAQTLAPARWGTPPDLVLAGPNVGANLGATTQLSGTVGVATEANKEGIPAIAFSGGAGSFTPWTALAPGDISHLWSSLAMKITDTVIGTGKPYLPAGTVLNVNFPAPSAPCTTADQFGYVFSTIYNVAPSISCSNGSATPTENAVIAKGCFVSVSPMNVDKLDVTTDVQSQVFTKLQPILTCMSS